MAKGTAPTPDKGDKLTIIVACGIGLAAAVIAGILNGNMGFLRAPEGYAVFYVKIKDFDLRVIAPAVAYYLGYLYLKVSSEKNQILLAATVGSGVLLLISWPNFIIGVLSVLAFLAGLKIYTYLKK